MRLCPILRNPDADLEAGGGPVLDAEAETEVEANEVVTISKAELKELRARAGGGSPSPLDPVGSLKARDAAHSREIAERDRKTLEREQAYKAALRDRELATALVGKPLVPGAASQLIKLWRDDFEVIDEDGEIRVLARDGRSVNQAVADHLGGSEFAHFCLPSSRGGAGTKGQNRSGSPTQTPASPKTLGEAVIMQWREASSRSQNPPGSAGWGRRR